jgi:hypothetical protein
MENLPEIPAESAGSLTLGVALGNPVKLLRVDQVPSMYQSTAHCALRSFRTADCGWPIP